MKILIKAVAGSHLFGTNTENSDHDYKGVFLPEADDILLGKFNQTIHQKTNKSNTKNTKDDVDIELYSLDKFLTMLYQGQTVAWELLFTPDSHILEKHPYWDEICAYAPQLVNKKVDAFIGYCKQQANKYGIRGSRMKTLEEVLAYLDTNCYHGNDKLSSVCLAPLLNLEHVEMINDKNGKELFVVCGKKFGLDTAVHYVTEPLKKYYSMYGERSRKAKINEGIDWKALSHAVRVCYQAIDLLENGTLQLPLPGTTAQVLKDIKAGEWTFEEVSSFLEDLMDDLLTAQVRSKLRREPDIEMFQKIQKIFYTRVIFHDY